MSRVRRGKRPKQCKLHVLSCLYRVQYCICFELDLGKGQKIVRLKSNISDLVPSVVFLCACITKTRKAYLSYSESYQDKHDCMYEYV